MTRSTHAAWDPDLPSAHKFTPIAANGHGPQPKHKRFTRLLELAIVERLRERMAQRAAKAKAKRLAVCP